jgi:homocysteine S-methyltransferase
LEKTASRAGTPVIICDFSPPRGPDRDILAQARDLDADFISVAYSPGRSVRAEPALVAAAILHEVGRDAQRDVLFNLSPRDMNVLALQNHLVGAALLGLRNVLVVQGDPFTERERALVQPAGGLSATELIRSIKALNGGIDFKGQRLVVPTTFCVGAALDLGKGLEREARLAYRKVQAGADFFLAQPVFRVANIEAFRSHYQAVASSGLAVPVFWGVQILEKCSPSFGPLPEAIQRDLERGRSGAEIALEILGQLLAAGVRTVYLIPPILKGGARDYQAAQRVLATIKR